jgi:hypothetical protein
MAPCAHVNLEHESDRLDWLAKPPSVRAAFAPPAPPPPRPANGSHRLPNTLGQVGEQYGPSIAPVARARCPFLPLLRPYSSGGAARGSHAGQFSCFGPRSCFIASVLDIPNGLQALDRAVGRAYIRKRIPTGSGIKAGPNWTPGVPRAGALFLVCVLCIVY